tara:strand:- start:9 stop:368 length:360 start_codon:yes stop_codon:yes gene_type:complete
MLFNQKTMKRQWDEIVVFLSNKFNDGQTLEMEGIIYLIGIQELGMAEARFKKDQKIDLMHIAICRLLEPFGYYQFEYIDKDGWPHYTSLMKLPNLKSGEQTILMKEAIINYFIKKQLIQ